MSHNLNRCLTEEDMQMARKHIKRCSTSYVTRQLQIHYTPIRKAKIWNTDSMQNRDSHLFLMGKKTDTIILENKGSYKTKHTPTISSSSHAPWYLPKGVES